ncbi:MAG: hypothetical protein JXA81_14145, partial [Sedimentisphaerales bacterium]|nr:hypothetical protein [Sedimentisphaerales bacterium]
MVENEKGYFGSPGFDHKQVTYCLGMLLLAFAAMTLSSCASSYDDTKWSDAEVAHLETMLDPNTIGLGYEFDWIEFNSVDGAEAEWLKRTRTLPGSHTFVVETSHVTKFVGWYSGQKTNYTRQIWLLTFPVTAGSHYHIVRGYKVAEPPSVYRILTPPQRKESWLQWYSNQEKIT